MEKRTAELHDKTTMKRKRAFFDLNSDESVTEGSGKISERMESVTT